MAITTHGGVRNLQHRLALMNSQGSPAPDPTPTVIWEATYPTAISLAATNTATVNLPTANVGDIRCVFINTLTLSAGAPTTPAGWTAIPANYLFGTYNRYIYLWWRVKESGDPDSFTGTFGPGGSHTYGYVSMHRYSGNNAAPVGASGTTHTTGVGSSTSTAPSITTTVDGSQVLTFVHALNLTGGKTISTPSVGDQRSSVTPASQAPHVLSDQLVSVAGLTVGPTHTVATTASNSSVSMLTVELKPA